ncbi:hypothetical protein PACILC2_24140 [Paenibacillus cisolokensis]|uniref:ABC transmembrane type-1 domain-containing protein n=1 Tax=Paenibacillus cisolokensis TaxID=1658519 RepID=A0ABQ4N6P6_9BACL|nr:hypothetical protein [Paenibacillus cisolokensis]GIQ63846.1 hypothetical protein PACILC2_24140 [Paenibacillus cisolokensis]
MVRNNSLGSRMFDYGLIAVVTLISLTSLFPIIHNLAVSLSSPAMVTGGFVTVYPKGFTFSSYLKLMEDAVFFRTFGISVQRVVITTILSFLFHCLWPTRCRVRSRSSSSETCICGCLCSS